MARVVYFALTRKQLLKATCVSHALVRNVRTWPAMPREKAQAATTARPKVPMRLPRSSDEDSVMELERRGQVIAVELGPTGMPGGALLFNGRRQPSCDGMSRMMREYHVRFCEGLGVKFPGPTRHKQ